MTKKQQQTIAVAIALALVLLGASFFFLYKPQASKKSAAKSQTVQAQAQTQALQVQIADLQKKSNNLAEAKTQAETLFNQFPSQWNQDAWLNLIAKTATDAKVTIKTLTVGNPADSGAGETAAAVPLQQQQIPKAPGSVPTAAPGATYPMAQSTISIEVDAPSNAVVKDFLSALESLPRPLLIDSVKISPQTGSKGHSGNADVLISARTFLSQPLPDPSSATATPKAAPVAPAAPVSSPAA